jgi:acetyl esterase/lipase
MRNLRVSHFGASGLVIGLGLGLAVLLLNLAQAASAAEPTPSPANSPARARVAGLASDPIGCLAADEVGGQPASGNVWLTWRGRVDRARLILTVSGSEAAHTIKVNGHAVALAPVYPDGQPCRNGEVFYLDIPPEAVQEGSNRIELTNDAQTSDSWTAAQVRLEVLGSLQVTSESVANSATATCTPSTSTVAFTNAYDGSSQEARAIIPGSYAGQATPLMVHVHGRSSDMYEGENAFSSTVQNKGWLFVAPQLHGSWPTPPSPPGKYAYASLESQYDILGAVDYMITNCNVDPARIYMYGGSMGGQIATVTGAKYPHLFAAIFDNKGATDMTQWYYENLSGQQAYMREECYLLIGNVPTPRNPTQNPFCYERRSSQNFARNFIHIPISITHSINDVLVPITHSLDLRDAINSFGPDRTAVVYQENSGGDGGPPNYHSYEPDPNAVLTFFDPFRLNNTPASIRITSDESKSYYWLDIDQSGPPHFTHVEATYEPANFSIIATINDAQQVTLGFNLGSAPIAGIIPQPGLGLPSGTYNVTLNGNNSQKVYTSGYFTVNINTTGQSTLTISLVTKKVYLPLIQR